MVYAGTAAQRQDFVVLLRARLRMLRNSANAMTSTYRMVIAALTIAGIILFSGIGAGCAAFIRLLQAATDSGTGLSDPAAVLVGHVYQYLFFFLLAGSVPFVASSLFQDIDLPLLLTTPISPTAVVGMKMVDATVSNSAQFLVLGVPVLVGVAWGVNITGISWLLFVVGVVLLMAVTPAITALVLLILAKIVGVRRIRFVVMGVSVVLALAITLLAVAGASRATQSSTVTPAMLQQALAGNIAPDQAMRDIHSVSKANGEAPAPAWLPSTWASQAVLDAAYGGAPTGKGLRSFGLLAATWVILFLLCIAVGRLVVTSEEILEQSDLDNVARGVKGRGGIPFPGLSQAATGLIVKDLRYIGRDTIMIGQIGTTLILFLVPFVLRATDAGSVKTDFDMYSGLSLLMSALVAYMVTSIIGLSSVGLEGRGAWALFASPVNFRGFLHAKWIVSFTVSLAIVLVLCVLDAVAFKWTGSMFWIAIAILSCMCFALSGIGVGLSGLFPRFLYDNPAHRASVWAMVLGFVFATLYVIFGGSFAVVGYLLVSHGYVAANVVATCIALFLATTLAFGSIPVWLAGKRLNGYQWEL